MGLRYFWEDDHNYYLVQDLMKGGELFNAIVHMQYFSEAQAQRCVLTLLCTLDYCHQRGIVHRDLKPENLLLAERDKLDSIRHRRLRTRQPAGHQQHAQVLLRHARGTSRPRSR